MRSESPTRYCEMLIDFVRIYMPDVHGDIMQMCHEASRECHAIKLQRDDMDRMYQDACNRITRYETERQAHGIGGAI